MRAAPPAPGGRASRADCPPARLPAGAVAGGDASPKTERSRKRARLHARFLVVGGGVAGVCCAQELARLLPHDAGTIHLVSCSDVLLQTASVNRRTEYLEEFSVFEKTADEFQAALPNVTVSVDPVRFLDVVHKVAELHSGMTISFDYCCICSGVKPKTIAAHPLVLALRDLNSIGALKKRLAAARRVAIVGNGGIALELAHELAAWDLSWVVRENYIGSAFFDATVAQFIQPVLQLRRHSYGAVSASRSVVHQEALPTSVPRGYSVGPEWAIRSGLSNELDAMRQNKADACLPAGGVDVHYEQEVAALSDDGGATWMAADHCQLLAPEQYDRLVQQVSVEAVKVEVAKGFPLLLLTSKGVVFGADFAVSATGVLPDLPFLHNGGARDAQGVELDDEGYIVVSNSAATRSMRSSVPYIFAAGDCCAYSAPLELPFVSMKLWTHARLMGILAAQSMADLQHEYGTTMQLELFAHVTRFFGYKVVLLGRYNGQGLGSERERLLRTVVLAEPGAAAGRGKGEGGERDSENGGAALESRTTNCAVEVLVRITPLVEVVKVVLHEGRVVGALLIGATDLEEVMENLILNQIDVAGLGIDLIDPDLDIGDYFD